MAKPVVGIIMGSKSDFSTMKKAGDILALFGVPFEMDIMSAHRTPDKVISFARQAKKKGMKVLICGAGMSAHLAGVVAANTELPVIGVPLDSGAGLGGMDALLSTSQMPSGVPVAAVAINGAGNAGLLAVKILAVSNASLYRKLDSYKKNMGQEIEKASKKLKSGESPL